jgi:hypothetical protein
MFLLGRLYFGQPGAWLAAAAYVYAPNFAVDLWVRSALAELAAFPFFPLALYGLAAYARQGRRRHLLLGAVAYAGVMFSHHASALFFTPVLVAFVAFTAWMAKSWKVLMHKACALLLGVGLAACVWLPSLVERQNVHIQRLLEGYLRYSNHLVYLQQLLYSHWGYGYSVPGYHDGMSFGLGWGHLVLAVLDWVWAARNPELADRRVLRFFGVCAILLSVLMLQDSLWLWDHLPLIEYIQFPWRLLGPVAVCVALIVGALGPMLWSLRRWRWAGFAGAMALLIVPNLSHLHPQRFDDVNLAL